MTPPINAPQPAVEVVDQIVSTLAAMRSPARPLLISGGTEEARSAALHAAAASTGTRPVNIGVDLAEAILNDPSAEAPLRIFALLNEILPSDTSPAFLDRIEILFAPTLKVNAIDLLSQLARRRPVCVSWPGEIVRDRIRYAEHGHSECVDADAGRVHLVDINQHESNR